MKNTLEGLRQKMRAAMLGLLGQPKNQLKIHGRWSYELFESQEAKDRGDSPIWVGEDPNGITNLGIEYLLEVGFRSDDMSPDAQIAPWYAGLIDNDSYSAVAAADTMASHAGWIESNEYDEATRQTLAFAAATSRAITASVSFTISATTTIRGIFVTSDDTISGTTGLLWSTALFTSPPSLVDGNVLTANYTLTD